MKALAFVVLLATALCAQADLYKCVDQRGRAYYSDKPVPACKPLTVAPAPSAKLPDVPPKLGRKPAAEKSAPASRAAAKAKAPSPLSPQERARLASHCKTLQEQYAWLSSPRGAQVLNREARLGQVSNAMRECP